MAKTDEQIEKEIQEKLKEIAEFGASKGEFQLPEDFMEGSEAMYLFNTDPEFVRDKATGYRNRKKSAPSRTEKVEALMKEYGFGDKAIKDTLDTDTTPEYLEYYGQPKPSAFHEPLKGNKAFGRKDPEFHRPSTDGYKGKLSAPIRQDIDISLVKGGPYPFKNEFPEEPESVEPVHQTVKNSAPEEKVNRRPFDRAMWEYAVYLAANGDTSLFQKLVGDRQTAKENEKNRKETKATTEEHRAAEKASIFSDAKRKAERALQDLNDINDSTKAKWANGTATADDVLNLRRAYRAYQYALDDAEAAARKASEDYNSNDVFDKTTGDLGINLDAMKGLDFNKVYTGERTLPYTATMASNAISSKAINDALNSADPIKAKDAALMVSEELEKFNLNHPSSMGLEEIQKIQNAFQDTIDKLNAVKAPTKNQQRKKKLEKSAEDEELAWNELLPKLNKETDSSKRIEMINKHNKTYGANRSMVRTRKKDK